jgi:hypothetical protein
MAHQVKMKKRIHSNTQEGPGHIAYAVVERGNDFC